MFAGIWRASRYHFGSFLVYFDVSGSDLMLVVVLPEVLFEDFRQGQLRYSSISSAVGRCRIGNSCVTAAAVAPNSSHAEMRKKIECFLNTLC